MSTCICKACGEKINVFRGEHEDMCGDCWEKLSALIEQNPIGGVRSVPTPTHAFIPIQPPAGLLESMATRYNHAFGLSANMSDEEIEELKKTQPLCAGMYLTSAERAAILITMRQIHEEVVGQGFYKYNQ